MDSGVRRKDDICPMRVVAAKQKLPITPEGGGGYTGCPCRLEFNLLSLRVGVTWIPAFAGKTRFCKGSGVAVG